MARLTARKEVITGSDLSGNNGDSSAAIGKVLVKWNPDTRELVVEDNGIGMNLDVIKFHLMRVGASYYDTPQFHTDNKDFSPISKFGIGIHYNYPLSR